MTGSLVGGGCPASSTGQGHITDDHRAIIKDEYAMRRIVAKVLVIATKEALGLRNTSRVRKKEAKNFLLSDWAMSLALYLGQDTGLERVRSKLRNERL